MLLIGDAAGLIHPLCGNGMAMAIHSAKLACDSLLNFENSMNTTRVEVERNYSKKWSKEFGFRMKVGRTLATILLNSRRSELLLRALIKSPFLLRSIIKMTHGKPITI
jgi:hypothetical protein